MSSPPVALSIAGSDSSGGAGIQADLKTFMALGVHGATAITALTAQNTRGVSSVHPVPADFVREQISQVFADAEVGAVKTGMLWNAQIVEVVADYLSRLGVANVVVDPVLVSTSRAALIEDAAVRSLVDRLLPQALLVTPNLSEASVLSEAEVGSVDAMKQAARRIKQMGPAWVLVKGGHLDGDPVDVLYDGVSFQELRTARVHSKDTHGSGCTLAAATTARIAMGDGVEAAVRFAKEFTTAAIENALRIGEGAGPVNPAWNLAPRRAGRATGPDTLGI